MQVAFSGKLLERALNDCKVIDLTTLEELDIYLENYADVQVGEIAMFLGEYRNGEFRVKSLAITKFLDPLYEENLILSSGKFTLVKPIDDPFDQLFSKLIQKQTEECQNKSLSLEPNTQTETEPSENSE